MQTSVRNERQGGGGDYGYGIGGPPAGGDCAGVQNLETKDPTTGFRREVSMEASQALRKQVVVLVALRTAVFLCAFTQLPELPPSKRHGLPFPLRETSHAGVRSGNYTYVRAVDPSLRRIAAGISLGGCRDCPPAWR